ncbi:fasciclin domain-containing protein [Pontibacter anaerobius]|uniref:Fasciclin domain-containing protein n=1 Tax=Pontibacter anaerobius TaxID=2993940 RepID=A0ABT3RGN5_9BACT|nr:fasciclin domain-containing protein [Pontibacter anaerobius]MCX2740548.1 fasciclin domain-containing protein [Pontibacter anaerobius]
MKPTQKNTYLKLLLIVLFTVWGQAGQAQQDLSVMEYVIKERPVLAGLLTKAGFTPLLSGGTPVTLLAPPESALQSISNEPPERLRAILSSHILKGVHLEKDMKDGKRIQSVCSTSVTIYHKKGQTLVNGVSIQRPDVQVKNGVVHELSSILRI